MKTKYGVAYWDEKRSSWYLRLNYKGSRANRSLKTLVKRDVPVKAKEVWEKWIEELEQAVNESQERMESLSGRIDLFLAQIIKPQLDNREIAPGTYRNTISRFSVVKRLIPEGQKIIDNSMCDLFMDYLKNHRQRMVRSYWIDINRFVKWDLQNSFTKINPLEDYWKPKVRELPLLKTVQYPNEEQWRVYLADLREGNLIDYQMTIMMYENGWNLIDLYEMQGIHFSHDGEGWVFKKIRGKAPDNEAQTIVRPIPIDSETHHIISPWAKKSMGKPVKFFQNNINAQRFSWNYMAKVRDRAKRLGLDPRSFHSKTLRSWFATRMIYRNIGGQIRPVPEAVLLKWMGHAESSTEYRKHYLQLGNTRQFL